MIFRVRQRELSVGDLSQNLREATKCWWRLLVVHVLRNCYAELKPVKFGLVLVFAHSRNVLSVWHVASKD